MANDQSEIVFFFILLVLFTVIDIYFILLAISTKSSKLRTACIWTIILASLVIVVLFIGLIVLQNA